MLTGPVKIRKEKTGGASPRRRMEDYAHSLRPTTFHAGNGLTVSLHQHDQKDFDAMDITEREAQEEMSM